MAMTFFSISNDCLFEMINDYLFEMSDSDLNRFEMIYDCHFEMTAKNFRQQAGKSMFSLNTSGISLNYICNQAVIFVPKLLKTRKFQKSPDFVHVLL